MAIKERVRRCNSVSHFFLMYFDIIQGAEKNSLLHLSESKHAVLCS